MGKHTPGPWYVGGKTWEREAVFSSDGIMVADCCIGSPERQTETCRANADLTAAAPDLLEALKDLVELVERSVYPHGIDIADSIRVFAKPAIAKAEVA